MVFGTLRNLDNESVIMFVLTVVGVFLVATMVLPPLCRMLLNGNGAEGFNGAMAEAEGANGEEVAINGQANGEAVPEEMPEQQVVPSEELQAPVVSPQTGALVDGPGYEQQPVDGAPIDASMTADQIPSNYYFLDDGAGGEMSIQHNLCSKSCCSEQWPTPFKQKYDPYVCGASKANGYAAPGTPNSDFTTSRVFCSNTFQDAGCLCLSKKQQSFLYNRGGNGREWF
jgi:hypothetical protein